MIVRKDRNMRRLCYLAVMLSCMVILGGCGNAGNPSDEIGGAGGEDRGAYSGEQDGSRFVAGNAMNKEDLRFISDYGGEHERIWLDGTYIATARAEMVDNEYGMRDYIVSITFNEEGAELFADATEELIGEELYIVYKDRVLSHPRVNNIITGGNAVIYGLDSYEEAEGLAYQLSN